MRAPKEIIKNKFSIPKNWHAIYQWERCTGLSYTEDISELLLKEFDKIDWSEDGLRKSEFKQVSHTGDCQLQTDISQFTEKRFCRALFSNTLEYFGEIIDYEIPLTEPKQGAKKKNHGDIDLLSRKDNFLFFIEAKKYNSTESLLKAILEIFVYTFRLHEFGMIDTFKKEYDSSEKTIIPAVLTFSTAKSGNQIKKIHKYPNLQNLIKRINEKLNSKGIKNIEFYVIENFNIEETFLVSTPPYHKDIKNYKIELNKPVSIKKYQI